MRTAGSADEDSAIIHSLKARQRWITQVLNLLFIC
jgi:hypothetical protein